MSMFHVQNLSAGYSKQSILRDVSFDAQENSIVGVLGANGSGKSTLLKAICGNLRHGGRCTLDSVPLESLPPRRLAQLCSYIPQRSGVSLDIAALDVALMGFNPRLPLLAHPTPAMQQQALDALDACGLGGKAHQNYMTLSEGQKQLCILARTLCQDAKLLLLDEPESALDFRLRQRMLRILRGYVQGGRRTALIALHDPALALNGCDKLLLLDGGVIAHTITPSVDSIGEMEDKLRVIYGSVSLHRVFDHSGRALLLMLKEEDA